MDIRGIGNQDLSPLSSKFHSTAMTNMQQNIASVKDNKDLKGDDKAEEYEDRVSFSIGMQKAANVTAEEGTLAAQNSGELAEATDELIQDDSEREAHQEIVGGPGYRETEETQGGQGTQLSRNVRQAGEAEISTDVDNEKIRSLRADVPDEIFDAATQIVKGQITNETRPAQSLTQLKNVGEVGMIESGKADFHPMMDIHDTHNQPLPLDMEEEVRA